MYENIYYKINASHEYGTEVNITIYVLKPVDKTLQYYTIDKVELKDADEPENYNKELSIDYSGTTTIPAGESYMYTIKYSLAGEDLPERLQLDVNFKALYYVELG